MKVLIFGATGSIGRQLVEQVLRQHTVTAFALTPAKLDTEHPSLQIIQGDVLDDGAGCKRPGGGALFTRGRS